MAKVRISTDSISDLGQELINKHNIPVFSLMINLGSESELDGPGMPEKIYAYVGKTGKTTKTAARGSDEYLEFFKANKPKNGALVHFTISKELSASYQNACAAAREIEDVYVVDSQSLSTGAGLLVMYAIDLAEKGLEAKEIFDKCQSRVKSVQASFIIDSLEYLHKGGRCSGLALFVSGILKIKPMLTLKDGLILVGKKYMARFDKAVDKYVNDILSAFNSPDLTRAFITYTTMPDGMLEKVKEAVQKRYPFKEIHFTVAGGTITSHCGPNTIGILYFNDGETK